MNEDGMFRMAHQQIKERLAEKQVELAPMRREAELLRIERSELRGSRAGSAKRALIGVADTFLTAFRRSHGAPAAKPSLAIEPSADLTELAR